MIPVHNHSEFSALDGYGKPGEIAERIKTLNLPGAFLTDHGVVAGFRPFAEEMAKRNLLAGFGMEAYQAAESRLEHPKRVKGVKNDGYHLILLAQSQEGYRNLLRLSDEANRTGFYYFPRLDWELLEKYNAGLICTSACMGSLLNETIRSEGDWQAILHRFRNIFRERFCIELHTYNSDEQRGLNKHLVDIANEYSIPVIYANDAHYLRKEQHRIHEIMMAIQYGASLADENYQPVHSTPSLYIMPEEDVRNALAHLPAAIVDQAISNSDDVMELCRDVRLPEVRQHLPRFKTPNSGELLEDLVIEGLQKRYTVTQEIYDRAKYEYDAIVDAGLADYFLIVQDFVQWAEKMGIMVGPGRGSAGGSILAYALGITHIDPIRYGLHFERFWNPGRTQGLPDIDVDFEVARRADVKAYLARRYGEQRVMQIGNHIRMGARSSIDRVAKALYGRKVSYADMNLIKRIIDKTIDAGQLGNWDEIVDEVGEELEPWVEKYPELFGYAIQLEGRIQSYGIHASAVVVSDVDLPEEIPAMMRTAKDDDGTTGQKVLATQLDMYGVEDLGWPKFDLLGLRNLDILKLTRELANCPDFDYRSINYNVLPDSYWEQIDNGITLGFFQIEQGRDARRIGKKLKPRSILDLAAIVALNRPGPLRSGATDRFLDRRQGASVDYLHPILESTLQETYGDFLYQEQVLEYFATIGYSLGEADEIRKILGKKLVEKMAAEKPRYLERAVQFMSLATAESILNDIEGFSRYSFNKAHAVAYATILAWTMYAKWKWPTEFIMASIVTAKTAEKIGEFAREGRRLGVSILPPDINRSDMGIDRDGNDILFGLSDIKGVGNACAKWVIEHRPYHSYGHFQECLAAEQSVWEIDKQGRSPKQIAPAQMIRALYYAGAFDFDGESRVELTIVDRLSKEEELLGVLLSDAYGDIIERNQQEIEKLNGLADLDEDSRVISVPGVVANVRKKMTRPDARKGYANKEMGFVTIDWQGEQLEFVAFNKEWEAFQFLLKPRTVGRFDLECRPAGPILIGGKKFI